MRSSSAERGWRLARALLFCLDPERAHRFTIWALRFGLPGRGEAVSDPVLSCRVWDLDFPNPIGLAAGFDKHAEVVDALFALGFGYVEAGTVTPLPQPGNPRPRLFRLLEDEAVINRFGFNSQGLEPFVERLRARPRGGRIVGVNIGKNRTTADAAADYVQGIEATATLADYIVCNVSSPNTPGLRGLQNRGEIELLLREASAALARAIAPGGRKPPLLVKVGPDLTEAQVRDLAEVVLASRIDGLIVGNTTVERPQGLRSRFRQEGGGLSGRPLLPLANLCLARMYRYTEGRIPIIGCGGIASGADAYAKIRAGATLVQLYSALVFQGPCLAARIAAELAALLRADGFGSVRDAIGVDHRTAGVLAV